MESVMKTESVKTTISIDEDLWRRFSILVIEEKGYRKKNEVIEELIREYVERMERPQGSEEK